MKLSGQAILLATGTALAFSVAPASAAVRYDFQAFSSFPVGVPRDIVTGNFSVTLANFIRGTVFVPASELTSCIATGSVSGIMLCDVQLLSKDTFNTTVFFGFFNPQGNATVAYYFSPDALSAIGTYDTTELGPRQAGRLTVSLVGGAVPEPATWAMMLTGFGAIGGAMRAQRRVTKVSYG